MTVTCKTYCCQQNLTINNAKCWATLSGENSSYLRRFRTDLNDEIADITSEMESLDVNNDKENTRVEDLSVGKKKFNMDPKKGIEYLVSKFLVDNTSEDIARFVFESEGLNKMVIGEYLGDGSEFNIKVLHAYVNLQDFANMILVQALRQFLWSFRLPGEAQKIDRMMECFAKRYCEQNPGIFQHPDTCYVLSVAVIMLNTILHNPNVKEKITVERFINMNRGINAGGNLPADLLTSLYDSIKQEPFKLPDDDGNDLMHTFFNPDREGWLWKQSGRYKNWKRRWLILKDNCLYYFEYMTDKETKGIVPLENIQVREVTDAKKLNCFELLAASGDVIKACKTASDGRVIEGRHTVYRMSANTPEEAHEWIKAIRSSISEHPFYDMLAMRRKKIFTD